jgi:eukaryotic-like serine/threonine-protein kinase
MPYAPASSAMTDLSSQKQGYKMVERSSLENEIIPFVMKREYRVVRELGQGACGRTVLLHDELIDKQYVCKKYTPYAEEQRAELFANFVREIKLLYEIHHNNVVRVFNHYLYPDVYAGFILMEFIEGDNIGQYVSKSPDKLDELFKQAVSGFAYLQRNGILHRDIRLANIMVSKDGRLKIIDLGFGKHASTSADFDKSISLNWWCQTPDEFEALRYDFTTEVYFVGKLFEKLLQENDIRQFKNKTLLGRMCNPDPEKRIQSFTDVETEMQANRFSSLGFDEAELDAYREFAYWMSAYLIKLETGESFSDDIQQIESQLIDCYRNVMLEHYVIDPTPIIRCFFHGTYYYKRKELLEVSKIRAFLELLQSIPADRKRIVLANLRTRLDSIPKYDPQTEEPAPPDLPF